MTTEADKFNVVVKTMLSVSHDEIKKRDEEWRRERARKKQTKDAPSEVKHGKQ
jgi:hypothetical protein